jgi:hypothetical protein
VTSHPTRLCSACLRKNLLPFRDCSVYMLACPMNALLHRGTVGHASTSYAMQEQCYICTCIGFILQFLVLHHTGDAQCSM